ncbi:phosphatidate cytidylyltransferase [Acholeplasma sp. OttesenSCG-928-E16]|nr:phosphatidate cytidylyltransferase [Acholeplasma sp. OttesenSCG-928-E16]
MSKGKVSKPEENLDNKHTSDGNSARDRLRKSSFKTRTITSLVIAAGAIGVVSIPGVAGIYVFQAMMLIFTIIGTFEMIKMYEKEKKIGLIPIIAILIFTALNFLNVAVFEDIAQSLDGQEDFTMIGIKIDYLPMILATVTVLLGLTVFCKDYDTRDASKALTIIFYVGFGMTSIVILRLLGIKFVVYSFLISAGTDVFAYLVGSAIGKHKMSPNISPKKSWEGAIGGTILATAIASCFAIFYGNIFQADTQFGSYFNAAGQLTLLDNFEFFEPMTQGTKALIIIPITLAGSIISQIGDLVASRIKRTYDVKDFGNIFPGHGGVLDRFDSLMFLALFLVGVFLFFNGLSVA